MSSISPFLGLSSLAGGPFGLSGGLSDGFSTGIPPQTSFDWMARRGFNAAFGANADGTLPAGPIQNLVNRLASQLVGSGVPHLAGWLPANDPFQQQYFGPPNPMTQWGVPDQFQVLGMSNPNPQLAMLTSSWSVPGFGATPPYAGQLWPTGVGTNPLASLRFWSHYHVSPYINAG